MLLPQMRARLARHQNAQMVTGSPTVDGLVPIGLGSHPVILPAQRSAKMTSKGVDEAPPLQAKMRWR